MILDGKITYWELSGNTGSGDTFSTGVIADAKTMEKQGIVKDVKGNDVRTSHRIYTRADIKIGSYVYIGSYGGDLSTRPASAIKIDKVKNKNPITDLIYYEV